MEPTLCHRCGHSNNPKSDLCELCQHHLYVFCHCGARNKRADLKCSECGGVLRVIRRKPLRPFVPPPARQSSKSPGDLNVALGMFAIVAALFGFVLFGPVIRAWTTEQWDAAEETQIQIRQKQDNERTRRIEQLQEIIEHERQRQEPMRKWIEGR